MPIKKEIVYPVFLECCQYSEDAFWETIFEDLAYGKAPYGSYINKDSLCCGYKEKEFSYKISRKDPKELYEDIYKLFTEKLGILSQKERIKQKISFCQLEKTIRESRNEWSGIRKKNIKDVMYEKYVIEMKKKFSLTTKQMKYLLSLLIIAIMFKAIISKDISFDGNKIDHIKGLSYENGEFVLARPFSMGGDLTESLPEKEETPNGKIKLSAQWDKFLKNLRKHIS